MKILITLVALVAISVSCAFGQTYYYKHLETIDSKGAKTRGSGGKYFTFSGKTCYESDKDGYGENSVVRTKQGKEYKLKKTLVYINQGKNSYMADLCECEGADIQKTNNEPLFDPWTMFCAALQYHTERYLWMFTFEDKKKIILVYKLLEDKKTPEKQYVYVKSNPPSGNIDNPIPELY
jgi:hypothetical protein